MSIEFDTTIARRVKWAIAINPKDVAVMLDELTIEVNEESFVIALQHGGSDVT